MGEEVKRGQFGVRGYLRRENKRVQRKKKQLSSLEKNLRRESNKEDLERKCILSK